MKTPSLFFVVGPLRTGSSLMSRCLDDHPDAICLCESEISRALFRDYFLTLHFRRMERHGLATQQIVELLNLRQRDEFGDLIGWYRDSQDCLTRLYEKPGIRAYGDKSPDFFRCPGLVAQFAGNFPLIYTVRDPRAIYRSIVVQQDASEQEKRERWDDLMRNFVAWEPYLGRDNVLCVRYEDLVTNPVATMAGVYRHIGLDPSVRFLEPFERAKPSRFLWQTAIDWESGIRREFDVTRIDAWQSVLSQDDLRHIGSNAHVNRFMDRFGYLSQQTRAPVNAGSLL